MIKAIECAEVATQIYISQASLPTYVYSIFISLSTEMVFAVCLQRICWPISKQRECLRMTIRLCAKFEDGCLQGHSFCCGNTAEHPWIKAGARAWFTRFCPVYSSISRANPPAVVDGHLAHHSLRSAHFNSGRPFHCVLASSGAWHMSWPNVSNWVKADDPIV